jgi:hypothetical protein
MTMHLSEDDLILHYYGELDEDGDARAREHLDACAACRGSFVQLQRTMAAIDSLPPPPVARGFEARVWQRLAPELGSDAGAPPQGLTSRWLAMAAAAVIVIAAAAFFAGRVSSPVTPIAVAPVADRSRPERMLEADLADHLDRAELALVELMNADGSDLPGERARAEDLVAANRLYRETAATAGDQNVGDVLEELERVLIEVAAAPAPAALGGLRQRVEARGLLFKLRVMRVSLREDESL